VKPRKCQACGEQFFNDERFCDSCGGPLPASTAAPKQAATIVAGRYELREEAGKGGMGIVYLAHDQLLNREVAFKLLHANLANRKSAPKRLLREARAAGRINHPNVIQIYDAGKLESDGRPYLVMEFLRGETLKEVLEANNGLPWPQLYPILRQILAGLAAAHSKEVIHRDLKPGNIFIEPDPAGPRVKLVDFGLSKILSTSGPGMTALTEAGAVLGTPLYMAPEQVRGDPASSLSDLFAVGVILYRGLTGLFPFNGANAVELYRNILRGSPVPPRQRTPERSIPEALDIVTLRALSVEPAQRPQSAEEFLRLLDQCAQGASSLQINAQVAAAPKKAIVYESRDDLDSQEETGNSEGKSTEAPKTILEMETPFALAPSAKNILVTAKPTNTMTATSFWEPQSAPSHPSTLPQRPTTQPPKPLQHPSSPNMRPVASPSSERVLQKAPLPSAPKAPLMAPQQPSKTPIPESPTPSRRVREMPLVVPLKPPIQSVPLPQQPLKQPEKTPIPNISTHRVLEMPALSEEDKKKK
jgi:serine/threonine protein kinase